VIRSVHAEERFGADGGDPMQRIALEAEAASALRFATITRTPYASNRDGAFTFTPDALLRGLRKQRS